MYVELMELKRGSHPLALTTILMSPKWSPTLIQPLPLLFTNPEWVVYMMWLEPCSYLFSLSHCKLSC